MSCSTLLSHIPVINIIFTYQSDRNLIFYLKHCRILAVFGAPSSVVIRLSAHKGKKSDVTLVDVSRDFSIPAMLLCLSRCTRNRQCRISLLGVFLAVSTC